MPSLSYYLHKYHAVFVQDLQNPWIRKVHIRGFETRPGVFFFLNIMNADVITWIWNFLSYTLLNAKHLLVAQSHFDCVYLESYTLVLPQSFHCVGINQNVHDTICIYDKHEWQVVEINEITHMYAMILCCCSWFFNFDIVIRMPCMHNMQYVTWHKLH